jgi:hypothetical protein
LPEHRSEDPTPNHELDLEIASMNPPNQPENASGLDGEHREIRDLAVHLIPLLIASGVSEVEIDVFLKAPSFHGPEVSQLASTIAHEAREEHLRRGFGFWQFSLAAAVDADPITRRGLFTGALRHSTGHGIRMALPISQFDEHLVAGDFEAMPARTIVSLCSRVWLVNGSEAHIAMLDFSVGSGRSIGEQAAVDALGALDVTGALFASGRSFHFYGDKLLNDAELVSFLARAQLLAPVTDERWATHQLIDGECRLRIGSDIERNRDPVRLVTHLS